MKVTGEHRAGYRDHVIFAVALGAGLREHELLALDVGDVFDEDGRAEGHPARVQAQRRPVRRPLTAERHRYRLPSIENARVRSPRYCSAHG